MFSGRSISFLWIMDIIYTLNINIIALLPNRKNPQAMNCSEEELKHFRLF